VTTARVTDEEDFMKRICLLATLSGLLFAAPVFAQNAVGNSEYYVINVYIEKIYSHQKGYIVEYRKNALGTERIYLPLEWFVRQAETETPRKGQIVKIRQPSLPPYIAVYYKDGKTDHVKLFVRDLNDQSWGNVANGIVLDDSFSNVDEIRIIY
jgi:hypothetical protein